MKAIMVMFDSLNRLFLPAYGGDIDLPNFRRLARHSVTFDRCYAGSMPCMPARREMHTGRHNFLHRGWGPLEPFDDSVPQMLDDAGVYTHLSTDHQHYWEDGGATYHNRYTTYDFIRGQEGDAWKGLVSEPDIPETLSWRQGTLWRQDWVNRRYVRTLADHSQTRTFDSGLEFIETNAGEDGWFCQIECFDPHEPFVSTPEHMARAGIRWQGPHFDWPDYRPVLEDKPAVDHIRSAYAALLTLCDESLGRVLDAMDRHDLWKDTLLIVCTDHGFLLGERGWYGKNVQPWYEETIHTPLFLWDPALGQAGTRCDALVQTIDVGPTLLDAFGVERTPDMDGRSLRAALAGKKIHDHALFGVFGGHVSITDGRYVYMRAPHDRSNAPLEEFTLMPTRMDHRMVPAELRNAVLARGFPFTKGVPLLQLPGWVMANPWDWGTLLFDLEVDPGQTQPLSDPELELRMANCLVAAMRANHAPEGQFQRLGLPVNGEVGEMHLACAKDLPRAIATRDRDWSSDPEESFSDWMRKPLIDLVEDTASAERLAEAFSMPMAPATLSRIGYLSPWQLAVMRPSMTPQRLRTLDGAMSGRVANHVSSGGPTAGG